MASLVLIRTWLLIFGIVALTGCGDKTTQQLCEAFPDDPRCLADGEARFEGDGECAQPCEGLTPQCNPETRRCVQCLESAHCPEQAPICGAQHTCNGCKDSSECAAADRLPHCDRAQGVCVVCVIDEHCADGGVCSERRECAP